MKKKQNIFKQKKDNGELIRFSYKSINFGETLSTDFYEFLMKLMKKQLIKIYKKFKNSCLYINNFN